jgi:3-oxoadipate enol-lactonase
MNFASTDDGCRIAYRVEGSGPALILSNSLGTNMDMWKPQVEALAAQFRVIRYDCRGHGGSDVPTGGYAIARLAEDALAVLDACGVARAHFCGLSMGGMVGQWLAARAPERLDRLILANTSAYLGPPSNWQARIEMVRAHGMAAVADAVVERWFTQGFRETSVLEVEAILNMLLATDPQGYASCCAAIRDMDLRPIATLNAVPTLVIAGAHDPATPPVQSEAIVGGAQNAKLLTLPAAHLSNIECAQDFTDAVVAFLSLTRNAP